jgi:hypothetical protein
MLPAISRQLLVSLVEGDKPAAIEVGVGDDGEFTYNHRAAGWVQVGAIEVGAGVL